MGRSMALLPWIVMCVALASAGGFAGRAVLPVRVAGGSMSPALEGGDIVFVARRAPVSPRDIVLIREPGRSAVLHRIVAPSAEGSWVTQGDANPVADLRPVARSAIVGRVVGVLRVGGIAREWREVFGGATLANQSDSTRR
jgi:signal peptidase I